MPVFFASGELGVSVVEGDKTVFADRGALIDVATGALYGVVVAEGVVGFVLLLDNVLCIVDAFGVVTVGVVAANLPASM